MKMTVTPNPNMKGVTSGGVMIESMIPNSCEKGLTLIEVMIALFVFTIGILSVANMQINSLNASSKATKGMYDTAAIAILLEEIVSWKVSDNRLKDVDQGYHPEQPDHGPFVVDSTGSTLEYEVMDDFMVEGMKRISVTLNRRDRGGRTYRYTYDYLKSDHME
jgi:prepilin-type N-terminal cleavage/methylation domain-containing protein